MKDQPANLIETAPQSKALRCKDDLGSGMLVAIISRRHTVVQNCERRPTSRRHSPDDHTLRRQLNKVLDVTLSEYLQPN
jgi:hypothetical protein